MNPPAGPVDPNDSTALPAAMTVAHAAEVLRPYIIHTPMLSAPTLSKISAATVYVKAEVLQRTGSFAVRGAIYKLSRLKPEERIRGVLAVSGGNHAQGVALAASSLGIHATVVMPRATPQEKISATRESEAQVEVYGDSFSAAAARARELQSRIGASFIHPFDDSDIIAGQGTVGLEIAHAWPEVEVIVVPVGGGGLIAGIAIAGKALNPALRVIGVQASAMPSMRVSLAAHQPETLEPARTIADGLNVNRPASRTLAAVERLVDEVVEVSEPQIAAAMRFLFQRSKLVVEGAGAVGVAALRSGVIQAKGKNVAVVLSGGNVALSRFHALPAAED